MAVHKATPSLVEVARAAGVSTATAGRALGDYGYVSQRSRERVLAAAASMGYRTNNLARGMITGSTHTLGVVVTDVANPFFATMLRGISDVAHPAGFEVLLVNTGGNLETEERALRVMSEQRVDGVILAPARPTRGRHVQHLVEVGIPLVLVDRLASGVTAADSVTVDNELAARQAVRHLVDLGHKRIGVVTESHWGGEVARLQHARRKGLLPSAQRLLGYIQALTEVGLAYDPGLVATASYDRTSALTATSHLLDAPGRPTAVLCTDNVLASGALRAFQEKGLDIPREVSLIGFDDEPWTTLVRPELTVVEQPNHELGRQAGEQLLHRLAAGAASASSPQHIRLEARLMIRGSTGPPRE